MSAKPRFRVLLYGFVPFGKYRTNVSEQSIRLLPKMAGVRAVVLPVRFDRAQFLREIAQFQPTHILGLGQCPRGRKIRVEHRAVNTMKDVAASARPIDRRSPPAVVLAWKIPLSPMMRASRNAGTYVCNYSMYVIARAAERSGAVSAFLHIPARVDPKLAVKEILRIISQQKGTSIGRKLH
ncbi:MAG TPA: hypothetical protein VLB83_02490 [Candidatus Paceibacterota bacterium]|nr:hypothetical protein [Candidatus Paceibacterota bacterium]